jgi:hypothetical protein
MYYDELIFKSKNKTKSIWKIIKKRIGNINCQNLTNNPQEIPNTFNEHFFTVADSVIDKIKKIAVILEIT